MRWKWIRMFTVIVAVNLLIGNLMEASAQSEKRTKGGPVGTSITLEVLNPRGEIPPIPVTGIVPRVKDLDGKKIGLIDNTKAGAEYFLDAAEELLKKKLPSATILRFRKAEGVINLAPKMYSAVAEKCDTFIYATGD